MAWSRYAYTRVLCTAVDVMCAWAIWREADITISAHCGLELRKAAPARWARVLGYCLNHLQSGHCELAIAGDIRRAHDALAVLTGSKPDNSI